MSTAFDVTVLILSLAGVWLAAVGVDWLLRLALGVPMVPLARHRLAGHPQPYRAWTEQQRPVMGGLTPTRGDRRRNEAIAARTEGRPYRLSGRVLVRQDKEQP